MKNLFQILTLSSLSVAALLFCLRANAANNIPENHCLEVNGSKRYLDQNYNYSFPRTVRFQCQYECKVSGKVDIIEAVSTVTIRNIEDDAKAAVCQGVKVKKVSWGYDYAGSDAFYAFDTNLKEIKEFAFENIQQNNATEEKYLSKLKNTLLEVARSYAMANSPVFQEASRELVRIANELPQKTTLLDKGIKKIVQRNGNVKFELNVESMVLTQIMGHAAWRIPSHQF